MPRLKRATVPGEEPGSLFEEPVDQAIGASDDESSGRPLADRMRPRTLNELVGQQKIVGPGRALRKMIEEDRLQSLIFWGPPGTGKTTLARGALCVLQRSVRRHQGSTSGNVRSRRISAPPREANRRVYR